MRQDHHIGQPHHHAGPAQPVHRDHRRGFPILSARRLADHLLRNIEKITVAVLLVVGTGASHRLRHGFQVRRFEHSNVVADGLSDY